jgi:hypothetical protein
MSTALGGLSKTFNKDTGLAAIAGAADAQGRIWNATFWGVVATQGIAEAAKAFSDMWKDGQPPEFLPPGTAETIQKFTEGPLRDVAVAAQGYKETLSGLTQAGWLNKEMFADYGTILTSAYDQARAGGASQQEALLAVMPLLAQMKQLHEQTGVALDANTEKLIAEAEAQGMAFPIDPMIAVRDILLEIAKVLGATIPESARVAGEAINNLPDPPDGVTYNRGGGGGGGSPDEGFAGGSGGWQNFGRGTPTTLHGIEAVVRPGDPVLPGQVGGESISVTNAPSITISLVGSSATPEAVAAALEQVLDRNTRGLTSKIQQVAKR